MSKDRCEAAGKKQLTVVMTQDSFTKLFKCWQTTGSAIDKFTLSDETISVPIQATQDRLHDLKSFFVVHFIVGRVLDRGAVVHAIDGFNLGSLLRCRDAC